MARIPINIPPGLTSDDTSYSTQQTYRYADHIRFDKNRAEVVKGFERISQELIPGIVRNVFAWNDNIGASLVALGSNSNLTIWRSGNTADITPPDYAASSVDTQAAPGFGRGAYGKGPYGQYIGIGNYATKTWSMSNFGQGLLASPRLGPMYMWFNDMSDVAKNINTFDGAIHVPEVCNFSMVTNKRQVIAFGTNEEYKTDGTPGGVYNPLCIRGSDIDGMFMIWNVDLANNSFEYVLPSGGSIVGAQAWGEQLAIWTRDGLWVGTFTADPSSVYRFDPVSGALGLLGPNAAVIVGSTAYWITPDVQLWACPLGGAPSMLSSSIYDETLGKMVASQGDKLVLSYTPSTGELRIDYPHRDDATLENSRYVLYHVQSGAWSTGKEVRTARISGAPLPYPVSARGFKKTTTPVGEIENNDQASIALIAAQQALGQGVNRTIKDNTLVTGVAAVQDMDEGESNWGFVFAGDNVLSASAFMHTLDLTPNQRVSVSYKAKVVANANTAAFTFTCKHLGSTIFEEEPVTFTNEYLEYKHENILMPPNLTNPQIGFVADSPKLGAGVVVHITDLKVETGEFSTAWSPSPADPNLYDDYLSYIMALVYEQDVSEFYYDEFGDNADGNNLAWSIETNDFALDENYTSMFVRGFYPDFIDQKGIIHLEVFLRMFPQDQNEIKLGPYSIFPGQEKVDLLGTGKQVRFRLYGSSNPAACRFGRHSFDAVPSGRR